MIPTSAINNNMVPCLAALGEDTKQSVPPLSITTGEARFRFANLHINFNVTQTNL